MFISGVSVRSIEVELVYCTEIRTVLSTEVGLVHCI